MVKVNNYLSSPQLVKIRVPQESIVGPFLFIVYINDLVSRCDRDVKMLLYADDTILYTSATDLKIATYRNQLVLNDVYSWCSLNRLSINNKQNN